MKEQGMAKMKTDTADHKRWGSNSIHLQDGGVLCLWYRATRSGKHAAPRAAVHCTEADNEMLTMLAVIIPLT